MIVISRLYSESVVSVTEYRREVTEKVVAFSSVSDSSSNSLIFHHLTPSSSYILFLHKGPMAHWYLLWGCECPVLDSNSVRLNSAKQALLVQFYLPVEGQSRKNIASKESIRRLKVVTNLEVLHDVCRCSPRMKCMVEEMHLMTLDSSNIVHMTNTSLYLAFFSIE
ncbi:hypothetical protein EVAR_31889_1 [Eumeta japonica]|uniref:Uncharacterized protein n=1 Tax=Eumeta variegata TaxID=151549 RepID=A0A4C1WZ51_EUMVA|nr:hypothetical protein EVAR_31889_1 [Eumeta japonica]